MRIVFMGTPEFAVPSLKILLEHHYEIAAVVTVPDKPSGRGQQLSESAVKRYAQDQAITILQPEKLKDSQFVEQLSSLKPDLFVIVAFRILPPQVFTIPTYGSFNLHASLLPKYRGAAPINWAIINGERETGVTTFFLNESVDTGNIILQARVPIGADDTAGDLHDKLSEVGAEMVLHTVRLIDLKKAVPREQNNAIASPAPKIFKEDCKIDWQKNAGEVHNFIRGLSPRPCAYTTHKGTTLRIFRSRCAEDKRVAKPGEILDTTDRLLVAAETGAIEILEVQQEGKKKLSVREFLRGYRINPGETFES
ncbi:MAG TPA: methionyl-tRNA formyltransferase [Bacteroidota bacterium]|nr:methionyl-tRNA formyltransferase [Bacteroidota bacterium]